MRIDPFWKIYYRSRYKSVKRQCSTSSSQRKDSQILTGREGTGRGKRPSAIGL